MLLNSSLSEYLLKIEKAIHGLKDAYVELFEEELLAEDRLNIRLRIRFDKGSLLELNEAVFADRHLLHSLGYRQCRFLNKLFCTHRKNVSVLPCAAWGIFC
jgi:hypothetical protein